MLLVSVNAVGFLGLSYEFRWEILFQHPYLGWLVEGILTTLKLSALAWLQALIIGVLVGAARTLPWRFLRAIGASYVELFRNIPLLVHLFFWYFAAPEVLPHAFQDWLVAHGIEFWSAVLGLGFYSGARFGEVFRAGIQAVPHSLIEASASTGLSTVQSYRFVVLPCAVRLLIPPLTGETLNLLKNSSLALTIGVAELTFMTRQVESYTARGLEAITAGTLIYLALCLVIAALMGRVERRLAIPGLIARGITPER